MDVVYRVRGRPRVAPPPELDDRRWPMGYKPGHLHRGSTLARLLLVHPGDVHFSQDHCHLSILHPIALQWSEWAQRASIQQRKMRHLQLISYPEFLYIHTPGALYRSRNVPFQFRRVLPTGLWDVVKIRKNIPCRAQQSRISLAQHLIPFLLRWRHLGQQ